MGRDSHPRRPDLAGWHLDPLCMVGALAHGPVFIRADRGRQTRFGRSVVMSNAPLTLAAVFLSEADSGKFGPRCGSPASRPPSSSRWPRTTVRPGPGELRRTPPPAAALSVRLPRALHTGSVACSPFRHGAGGHRPASAIQGLLWCCRSDISASTPRPACAPTLLVLRRWARSFSTVSVVAALVTVAALAVGGHRGRSRRDGRGLVRGHDAGEPLDVRARHPARQGDDARSGRPGHTRGIARRPGDPAPDLAATGERRLGGGRPAGRVDPGQLLHLRRHLRQCTGQPLVCLDRHFSGCDDRRGARSSAPAPDGGRRDPDQRFPEPVMRVEGARQRLHAGHT